MVGQRKIHQKASQITDIALVCGKHPVVIINHATTASSQDKATTLTTNFYRVCNKQYGVVLVVSLIMLLLLTLIGLSGMQSTILEEKMAGNMRDRNMAFQAAEAALVDAEQHIIGGFVSGFTGFTADCGASTPDTTDNGLCFTDGINPPVWENPNVWVATRSVEYGGVTNAKKIGDIDNDPEIDVAPALSAQPRYIIEAVQDKPNQICDGNSGKKCYRITARGQGVNPNTVVILQTIYKPS